jgi:hypothetical protein
MVVRRMNTTLFRFSVSLILGIGVAVAIAWFPVLVKPSGYMRIDITDPAWFVAPPPGTPPIPSKAFVERGALLEITNLLAVDGKDRLIEAQFIARSGWPCLCLGSGLSMSRTPPSLRPMPGLWSGVPLYGSVVLPTRPIAFGLFVNSAIYASLVWALQRGAVRVKSHWRVNRLRCPCCGYPTQSVGSNCPECGRTA